MWVRIWALLDWCFFGPLSERAGLLGASLRLLRYPYAVLRDLSRGEINLRAMSLVYTTLLSLIPLLAFSFAVLKIFGGRRDLEPLVFEFFGYIARMARAGTIEALESDYARTATLKGLKRSVVIRRHVLRNSLLPTITVIATQIGYLIGGLVVVETLFNYDGVGRLIFTAATNKDFPMLEAGVLTIGAIYMVATLLADLLNTWLNPRLRTGAVQ